MLRYSEASGSRSAEEPDPSEYLRMTSACRTRQKNCTLEASLSSTGGPPMPRLPLALIVLLLASLYVPAARAQVWLDASQLNGKLPDWIDQRYLHPTDTEPSCHRIWIEPVYRTVSKRIWHEP